VSFTQHLSELYDRVEGSRGVCLVAADGIIVESWGGHGLDLEALAVEMVTQARALSNEQRGLGVGRVQQVTVSTDRCTILLGAVSDDYYLVLVLAGEAPQGRARFELRRAPLLFSEELA
jgi:predicted regulator of Ras-like GTPase activity (Roadblock/LC7/MglB family)